MTVSYADAPCGAPDDWPDAKTVWTTGIAVGDFPPVDVGHLLIVMGSCSSSGAVLSSITLPGGGSLDVDVAPFGPASLFVASCVIANTTQGDGPLTFTFTSAVTLHVSGVELVADAGFDASRVRATATHTDASSGTDTPTGTTDATPTADDFAVCAVASPTGRMNGGWSDGFSNQYSPVWVRGGRKNLDASGAVSSVHTDVAFTDRSGVIVVYKEAPASDPTWLPRKWWQRRHNSLLGR